MNVSVYISSEQIQMIGYEGRAAKRFVTHPLPEGAMYNGTIIDRAYMVQSLKTINTDNPGFLKGDVNLIVDGSSILTRKIQTPKLNPKQLLNLVRDEFSDTISDPSQIVCGYRQLKTGESAVMGYAVTMEQMESYVSVFAEADVKLSSIRVGTESLINFVESRQELHASTIVMNIIDGMTMLSMIFAGGRNVFISRTRLYGDDDEQMLGDILNNFNGMMQFAQSQDFGGISTSYYIGLSAEDISQLSARNQHHEVAMRSLQIYDGPGGTPPPETHFCCLNIQMPAKCVDFLAVYKKMTSIGKSGRSPKKILMIAVPALLVIGLTAMAVDLFMQVSVLDKDIEEVRGQIESPVTQFRLIEINMLGQEVALLTNVADQAEKKAEWEAGLTPATSRLMDTIIFDHEMEVSVNSFNYNESSRNVRISAICADATVSADYVDYLYDCGVAERVTYVGYGSAGGGYSFSVDILLNLEWYTQEEDDEIGFEMDIDFDVEDDEEGEVE